MIIHLLGAAALVALPPKMLIARLVLFLVLAVSLIHTLRRHAFLQEGASIRQLIWSEDGTWTLKDRNGVLHEAELLPGRYVVPWLVVLNFRLESGSRHVVVLASDSETADVLRRLRVRLLRGRGL